MAVKNRFLTNGRADTREAVVFGSFFISGKNPHQMASTSLGTIHGRQRVTVGIEGLDESFSQI